MVWWFDSFPSFKKLLAPAFVTLQISWTTFSRNSDHQPLRPPLNHLPTSSHIYSSSINHFLHSSYNNRTNNCEVTVEATSNQSCSPKPFSRLSQSLALSLVCCQSFHQYVQRVDVVHQEAPADWSIRSLMACTNRRVVNRDDTNTNWRFFI